VARHFARQLSTLVDELCALVPIVAGLLRKLRAVGLDMDIFRAPCGRMPQLRAANEAVSLAIRGRARLQQRHLGPDRLQTFDQVTAESIRVQGVEVIAFEVLVLQCWVISMILVKPVSGKGTVQTRTDCSACSGPRSRRQLRVRSNHPGQTRNRAPRHQLGSTCDQATDRPRLAIITQNAVFVI
jgi:hypothetical protein